MKNDLTTTFLNFVLAVLVIAVVILAIFNLNRTHQVATMQVELVVTTQRAQSLVRDVVIYNSTAKSPELNQILQTVIQQPAK